VFRSQLNGALDEIEVLGICCGTHFWAEHTFLHGENHLKSAAMRQGTAFIPEDGRFADASRSGKSAT
jgi:hypothetical protein